MAAAADPKRDRDFHDHDTLDLDRVDYTDAFRADVRTASGRSALGWARAIFEGAPVALRDPLTPGWTLLRLELGSRRAPDLVLGWPIVEDRPERVVLGTRSRLGVTVRLVVERDDATVRFTTLIRPDTRAGRIVWTTVAPIHRTIVRYLVKHATRCA